ncbi:CHAT domain-containing protein [Hymenobacter sp. AT01-02]|uniref:CHAT domain-containing protein n=1 Tax=Hymenobacter sp. AT01-02 TaxID=1571877 RepID=UPI0005F16206|nr:CHAT domain-containing protein [Hymenobacter sp. AT01-02]
MKIKEAFPTIYTNRYDSSAEAENLWLREYIQSESETFYFISLLLSVECDTAAQQPIAIFRKHIQLIFDGLTAAKNSPETVLPHLGLELLILLHGANVAPILNQLGALPENFDTFTQSLYGKKFVLGEEYSINTELLWRFMSPQYQQAYPVIDISQIIARWLGALYYYSKAFGGLLTECAAFVPGAIRLLDIEGATTQVNAQLATQLHGWAISQGQSLLAAEMLELIEILYADLTWNKHPECKLHLGVQLVLTLQNRALRKRLYDLIINQPGLHLVAKMQMTCQVDTSYPEIQANFAKILTAVRNYSSDVETRVVKPVEAAYEKSRLFNTLEKLVGELCRKGASTQLAILLNAFYHPGAQQELPDGMLFIIPNAEEGVIYCALGRTIIHRQDTRLEIPKLVDIMNLALSQLHSLRGHVDQVIPVPTKGVGRPMYEYGEEFEQTVSAYYNLNSIKSFDLDSLTALCAFNFNHLPLQALMIKELGMTLPIYVSLQPKAPTGRVRSVLLWQGNSMTSELESDVLAYLFQRSGAALTILREGESTKQDFMDAYQSNEYDVVWISSHGELGNYEPDTSHFYLSGSETVNLTEIAAVHVEREMRRLFFLNICEGGANAQIGDFRNVGFGHVLSTPNQDVLSHLWMTDPWVALVFGVLIAVKLSEGSDSYFEAYTFATKSLLEGRDYIIAQLSTLDGENMHSAISDLVERLTYNSSMVNMNILRWGSGVYYM